MHLTLPFPASVDDLADFIAAARQLGGTDLQVHIDGEPVGAPDDFTALAVVLSGALSADPKPEPVPELPPAAKAEPTKPKRGGGRPPATSGTCRHHLATTLADAGGRWTGSASSLAETWQNPGSARTEIRNMAAAGLVEQHQPNGRNVTAITLTPDGWKFIGRTPPASIGRPVAAVPDAPAAPKIPDLGPIERRPFDPDAVRNAQADAL